MAAPVETLKQVPLFAGLKDKELKKIAQTFRDRSFAAGAQVTTEGDNGIGFFVIESGTATVTVQGAHRRTLGPGDHFGEMALLDSAPRSATITANSELRCWGLTPWEFRPLVESNPTIAMALLQTLAQRLREQ
jgi:CRP/FNR family cyclic AMP-dependent transcriptional regulator